MRNAVDGRSGLHAKGREALAPARLVMPLFITRSVLWGWGRMLLLVLLVLLLAVCLRLISRRARRFVEIV